MKNNFLFSVVTALLLLIINYTKAQVPTVQDCMGAIPICENVYTETNSYEDEGNYEDEIYASTACPDYCMGSGELNDVWYTFTVQASGNLSFLITPNDMSDDYDWAVYDLTSANCSDIYGTPSLQVSCNWSDDSGTTGPNGGSGFDCQDHFGTAYNATIPVNVGETYVINVSNFSSTTSGFEIDFTASSANIFDNIPPYLLSVDAVSCNATSITLNFSENVLCSTVETADFILTGPGGPYTITSITGPACAIGGTQENTYTITVTPSLSTNGTYTLTLDASLSGSVEDLCGNTAPTGFINFVISDCVCTADAGSGAKVCGLDYTFNGSVQAGYYNTFWTASPSAGVTFGDVNSPTSWVTVTTPGLYTFTWTVTSPAAVSCNDVITVDFTQIPTSPFTTTIIDCGGDNTTIIYTGNATCATATFTWNFDGGTVTSGDPNNPCSPGFTVSWATGGTHIVTLVVEEDGCTSTPTTVGVYNPDPLVTSIDTTNAACAGNYGSVSIVATGGTNPYTYDWYSITGDSIITVTDSLAAGDYSVTITDFNDCFNIEYFTITEPNPLVISTNQTNVTCYGFCDGYASLNLTGGTGPYIYVWEFDPFHFLPDHDSLCAGEYIIIANDYNLCQITAYFTITEPASFIATITDSSDVSCNGLCDGSATVTATGGAGSYSYEWSGSGETTTSVSGLCGGIHTVTVTDANLCPAIATVSITEPVPLTTSISGTDVSCFNGNNGDAAVSASGGTGVYSYNWNPYQPDSPNITNLSANTYYVTITDENSCSTTDSITIVQPPVLTTTITGTDLSCYGDVDGSATVTVSGGTGTYSYNWSPPQPNTNSISNLAGGTYAVTVTDGNGCTITTSVAIFEPPEPAFIITPPYSIICIGQEADFTAQEIFGTGTPPFTFYWSNGFTGQSQDTNTVGPDTTYIYSVYAIDDNGCQSSTQNVTVYVYPPLNITLSTDNDTICPGDSVIINADVSGGNGGLYYIFLDGAIDTLPLTIYPVITDYYIVSVQDSCTVQPASDTIEIVVADVPEVVMNANPLKGCEPLTVQFLESSPDTVQTYVWNFDDASISTDRNPLHTFGNDGTYDVTLQVTSVYGCITIKNKTIEVYANPDAKFRTDPLTTSILKPLFFFENLSTNDSINHWYFDDGDSVSITAPGHTYHKYSSSGNYTVRLIAESKNGCKDTTDLEVIVKDEFTFYAPTAFTPDNDNVNDIFLPVGIGIDPENFLMLIYDRWGEKVFVTHDLYQGWDGKIKGKKTGGNGVYSWLVIYKDLQGVEHQQAGAVSLIR